MSTKGTQWSDKGSIKTRFRLLSFLSIREEHSKQHKPKTGSKHKNGHNNGLIANRWLDSCSLKEPGETSQSRCIMEFSLEQWYVTNEEQPLKTMEPEWKPYEDYQTVWPIVDNHRSQWLSHPKAIESNGDQKHCHVSKLLPLLQSIISDLA